MISKMAKAAIAAATAVGLHAGVASQAQDDPYLWLEGIEDERALEWVRAQNARSLQELEGDARFKAFHESALAIYNSQDRIPSPSLVGSKVRNFWQDETHIRGLWREASLESYLAGDPQWEIILDFDRLAEIEGENWVFAGATCLAPENDRCMLTLSRGGSDAAVRREFDVAARAFVSDGFSLEESKGGVAWGDADTLLVGADFGENSLTASGYPRIIRLWKRGTPIAEAPNLFEGEESDVGAFTTSLVRDGRTWTFIIRAITFYDSEIYMIEEGGALLKLALPLKSSFQGVLEGFVIASLQQDWSHRRADFKSGDIVAYDPNTDKAELVFRPSRTQAVGSLAAPENALLVQLLDNIVGRVKKIERKGRKWRLSDIDLPGEGEVSLGSINAQGDDFFLTYDSPTEPSTLYYAAKDGKLTRVRQNPHFYDAAGVVMRQFKAKSADGTDVPYFVIGRESVLNAGNAPVIQYGYGGFEVPETPGYSGVTGKLWYENGGVWAIANIRGGGEFGPRWHQAALKENRQRAYDDFIAVSEDLIRRGLTSPKKLGALGGSNGGLLMGVAMTQRPDLYGALGIGVPLLDMKRYTKLLAGASWAGEYGDPDNPDEWAYIAKYSPYQNLDPNKDYPRPFIFTSTKDDRVHPGHARKFAARLEEYGKAFLYYENIEGGHGAAANQNQAAYRAALQYVYFMRSLADPAPSPSAGE